MLFGDFFLGVAFALELIKSLCKALEVLSGVMGLNSKLENRLHKCCRHRLENVHAVMVDILRVRVEVSERPKQSRFGRNYRVVLEVVDQHTFALVLHLVVQIAVALG